MNIYNTTAQHALTVLKSQTLYDEVEAEVSVGQLCQEVILSLPPIPTRLHFISPLFFGLQLNLCFDQLVFEISQNLFTTFKAKATSTLLNRKVKDVLVARKSQRLDPAGELYSTLLKQRHLLFLGRTIDFKQLLAQVSDLWCKFQFQRPSLYRASPSTSLPTFCSPSTC